MTYVPAVITLMLLYMTALVGFTTEHQRAWYLFYVPFFLLLNALFLFLYHQKWNKAAVGYVCACLGLGFVVESLAVNTGLIFGEYRFGDSLGITVMGVPLVMAFYWFMLAYSAACLAAKLPPKNRLVRAIIGALLMAILAGIVQQVAAPLDFWHLAENISRALGEDHRTASDNWISEVRETYDARKLLDRR